MTAAALTPTPSAAQTTYYWNGADASASPANGGTGTWNTTTGNWRQATDTGSAVAWPGTSSSADSAVFAGTSGTVTLSGSLVANALSFTVDAYTLTGGTLGLDGTAPSLSVTTGTATIESRLVGSGSLTKTGVGTLTLSGANAYSGGTIVAAGTLEGTQVAGTPFGTGDVTVAGGRLAVKPSGSGAEVTVGNATSAFTFGGGTLALDRGANTSLTYEVGSMARVARGSLVITESTAGALGNTELFKAATAPGNTLNANLVNLPAVVQHPNGTADFLRYDATNGLVNTAGNYSTPNTSSFTPATNAILNVTANRTITGANADYTIAGLRVVNATLTPNAGTSGDLALLNINNQSGMVAPLILDSGTISTAGFFRIQFGSSEGAIYVTAAGGNIAAALAGTAGYTKYGPGTLIVSNGNNVSLSGGTITINGGLLSGSVDSHFGANTLPMVMNGGGLQATGTISFSTSRQVTLQAAGGRFDVTGTNTLTVPGVVSGVGGLAKTGSGTLVLSGTNGYSGGTTVTGGILRLSSTTGAGSGAVALAGGTLSLFRSSGTTTYANAISVAAGQAGTLRVDGSGTNNSTYATGTITVDGALTVTRTSGSTANTIFDSRLVGSGTLVVDNTNGGVIPVTGTSVGQAQFQRTDNTFNGRVVVQNGGNFLNNTVNPSYGSVDIGADSLLTLVATSGTTTTTVGTLTGAGTVIRNNSPGTQTTLSVAAGDFSGVISSGTLFTGAGTIALTKTGTGTLSLGGVNTYSGRTLVSAGLLALGVNGSFANSNEIKVGEAGSSGAILDLTAKTAAFAIGTGQMLSGGGTVLVAPGQQFLVQGTFSPGNSPGLFTFDGGTTVLSGTTVMEIFGTSRATSPSHGTGFYDAVNIVDNGILQFGGNLTLEFSGLFDNNTTFDLFTPASGSMLDGNFTGVTVIGGFYTGLEWNQTGSVWKSSSTTAGQSLEFSAFTGQLVIVPEPSTIALLAACGCFALLRRNRRRLAHRKAVEHSRVEHGTATGSCPLSSMSQRL